VTARAGDAGPGDLGGRTALVTGAARGLGRAIAGRLAAAGAAVWLVDRDPGGLETATEAVRRMGGTAAAQVADLADTGGLAGLVEEAAAWRGGLDVLVNNAGVMQTTPFLAVTPEDYDRLVRVNQTAVFFLTQAAGRHMATRGRGAIVNIASVAGRGGRPLAAHYAATKAAVISLTRSAALALAPHGVRVNAVCPGVLPTAMMDEIDRDRGRLLGLPPGEAVRRVVATVPLGRAARLEEAAEVVAFLASDRASYVTGQAVNVCGGLELD
jgi:NAD(P)-dependent dehydrogenase (short-subunit alcohol dehydrogenase family)